MERRANLPGQNTTGSCARTSRQRQVDTARLERDRVRGYNETDASQGWSGCVRRQIESDGQARGFIRSKAAWLCEDEEGGELGFDNNAAFQVWYGRCRARAECGS